MTAQEQKTSDLALGYGIGVLAATVILYNNPNKHIMIARAAGVVLLYALYLKNK